MPGVSRVAIKSESRDVISCVPAFCVRRKQRKTKAVAARKKLILGREIFHLTHSKQSTISSVVITGGSIVILHSGIRIFRFSGWFVDWGVEVSQSSSCLDIYHLS